MKIYTKKGDAGQTSLVGGARVSKASDRVCAYGDMDELISHIGILRCHCTDEDDTLRRIQQVLMNGSAHVASEGDVAKLKPIDMEETAFLENEIDRMTAVMPAQTAFILPSRPLSASQCHVARCVCRRAERSCVALEDERVEIQKTLGYLNRLSDYLFTLGRYRCFKEGVEEDFWLP